MDSQIDGSAEPRMKFLNEGAKLTEKLIKLNAYYNHPRRRVKRRLQQIYTVLKGAIGVQ